MDVAILTVGDEVLAGDVSNTNAEWLATQLTDRGARVVRILTVPDDRPLVADTIRDWSAAFDATLVTGGLGGTHDDVTADALADAFDRNLVVSDAVRDDVVETVEAYREANPDAAHDLDVSVDAWAALPEGSRAILNPEGLCPGCVVENVYAFPGIPAEMRALFDEVAEEFDGDAVTRTLFTPQPEGTMVEAVAGVHDRFAVTVGSYPTTDGPNRLKVTGTDAESVAAAVAWLRDHVDVVDEP